MRLAMQLDCCKEMMHEMKAANAKAEVSKKKEGRKDMIWLSLNSLNKKAIQRQANL